MIEATPNRTHWNSRIKKSKMTGTWLSISKTTELEAESSLRYT